MIAGTRISFGRPPRRPADQRGKQGPAPGVFQEGLVLSGQSPGAGEEMVNFACQFEGGDVEIGFNPAFAWRRCASSTAMK